MKRGAVKLLLLLGDPDSMRLVYCHMLGLAPVLRVVKGARGSRPVLRIWRSHENISNQYNFHMLFSLC